VLLLLTTPACYYRYPPTHQHGSPAPRRYYELGVFSAAIFGSATQAVGSGIFGFLVWFARDPALIRFETMYVTAPPPLLLLALVLHPRAAAATSPYYSSSCYYYYYNYQLTNSPRLSLRYFTVLPAWGGWMLGFWDGEKKDFMFVQVGSGRVVRNIVRSIFAFFAASVGTFTLLAWRRGSIDAMIAARASKQTAAVPPPPPPDHGSAVVYVPPDRGGGTAGGRHRDGAPPAALTWTFVSLLAFVVGWVLVANIGMGNSAATFISCTTLLVEDTRTCIVTAIVAGGWTSILPTLCHAFVFDDLPLALLLFVTPGLWLGSFLGPLLSEDLGERSLLLLVSMFMLAAALAMAVEVLVDTAPFTPGYREHRAPPSSEYGT